MAKKSLASSRKSFSSFRRRIPLSCPLTRLRSMVISSDRLIALAGGWEPFMVSILPALMAFSHVWMILSGVINLLAALAPPISLASFNACTLCSWSYFHDTLNTPYFLGFIMKPLRISCQLFYITPKNLNDCGI